MAEVILILGSNLNDKEKHIDAAVLMLRNKFKILKTSSKYTSKAWGYESENDYMNVAVSIECNSTPQVLLKKILTIENELGRVRRNDNKYMDRTIDIDIILYGDEMINFPNLTIPHPKFHLRNFCLTPMKEIVPNKIIPGFNKSVSNIHFECQDKETVTCLYDKV